MKMGRYPLVTQPVLYSPGKRTFVTGHYDNTFYRNATRGTDMISFGISPDSGLIATTSNDSTINIFAADSGK